ncbi:hypothetical protein AB0L05_40605 [Nonomuraea pusilla]|uniref:hypothetical protein n=1 Tax=Nonomuraea pusilla TaxID=46177 RepID=UPI003332DDAD
MTEEPQQLVRLDSIVSVAAVPLNDRDLPDWDKIPPRPRLFKARRARIMVGTQTGALVCALTCPGSSAQAAVSQLISLIASPPTPGHGRPAYVHGPRRSWPGDYRIWRVESDLPDPDLPPID